MTGDALLEEVDALLIRQVRPVLRETPGPQLLVHLLRD